MIKKQISYYNNIYGRKMALLILLLFTGVLASAQSADKLIRKGNKKYQKEAYTDAEANYKKALSKDSHSATGLFNLGNSLYHQQRYKEAMQKYAASAENSAGKLDQSGAYYNMGNTFMQNKQWQKAIHAYEQSLLDNPADDQARYNLAYAKAMLKKNKGGGGSKNNKNKNNDKNNKNKNQNQQNKKNKDQNKDQQNQQKNQEQQQQQHPKPQPSNISRQRADQLLDAAAQLEKKLQEEKDKKKKGIRVYNGKDW